MGIFELFKPKKIDVKPDYINDQFNILEKARTIVSTALVRGNDNLIILSETELTQLRKVYEIIINYRLNSNYLFVYLFGNNVKFNTKNITFNGLEHKYLDYFIENSFPIKLFYEQISSVDLIKITILNDLFNIKDIEFIKILDKSSDFKTAVRKYNSKNIEQGFSKSDSEFLLGIKSNYLFNELMGFDFFKNSIYSIIYNYNYNKFDDEVLIKNLSDKMIDTLLLYYKKEISISEIFIFIQGINHKELLDYIYELSKILDSSEFIMLTQESKNLIIDKQFSKINDMILNNVSDIESKNLNTINNLLDNM